MVVLHRLKGAEFTLNADLIESIEANPDTVITTTNEKKFVVQESPATIQKLVREYKRDIFQCKYLPDAFKE